MTRNYSPAVKPARTGREAEPRCERSARARVAQARGALPPGPRFATVAPALLRLLGHGLCLLQRAFPTFLETLPGLAERGPVELLRTPHSDEREARFPRRARHRQRGRYKTRPAVEHEIRLGHGEARKRPPERPGRSRRGNAGIHEPEQSSRRVASKLVSCAFFAEHSSNVVHRALKVDGDLRAPSIPRANENAPGGRVPPSVRNSAAEFGRAPNSAMASHRTLAQPRRVRQPFLPVLP
jgi:hypothetical protein